MITFKQYINEGFGSALAAAAIAGAAMAAPPQEHLPQIDRILTGVGAAEHRGRLKGSVFEFDPTLYVRTGGADKRGGGKPSSAYGPFQFTKSTIQDLSQRHPDIFSGSEKYVSSFIKQGRKMLANPNDPKYGYGGSGDLATKEQHQQYMDMSRAGVAAMAKDLKIDMSRPLSPQDESRLVQRFRGVPLEKAYRDAYYKAVSKAGTNATTPTTQEEKPKSTAAPTQASDNIHHVRSGDTLGAISEKSGTPIKKLLELNPDIKDANKINIGQKIRTK